MIWVINQARGCKCGRYTWIHRLWCGDWLTIRTVRSRIHETLPETKLCFIWGFVENIWYYENMDIEESTVAINVCPNAPPPPHTHTNTPTSPHPPPRPRQIMTLRWWITSSLGDKTLRTQYAQLCVCNIINRKIHTEYILRGGMVADDRTTQAAM